METQEQALAFEGQAATERALLERWLRSCGMSESEAEAEALRLFRAGAAYRFDFTTNITPRSEKRFARAVLDALHTQALSYALTYDARCREWQERIESRLPPKPEDPGPRPPHWQKSTFRRWQEARRRYERALWEWWVRVIPLRTRLEADDPMPVREFYIPARQDRQLTGRLEGAQVRSAGQAWELVKKAMGG